MDEGLRGNDIQAMLRYDTAQLRGPAIDIYPAEVFSQGYKL
jgi:hypothetical protein